MRVRANLNFGEYRQNKVYDIGDDAAMLGLVGVGYLTEITDDTDDHAVDGPVPDNNLVVPAAPKRKRKVTNGPGESESNGEDPDSQGVHSTTGSQDN